MDKLDTNGYANFEPEEIDLLLNLSQERFIKQRYGLNNLKKVGFEGSQKRMDDLKALVKGISISVSISNTATNQRNGFFATLPADYLFAISEECGLYFPPCNTKSTTPASGSLVEGTTYIVTSGSITFDGDTYAKGRIFTANVGDQTYTGTGKFVKADSIRAEVKPIQHDDYNRLVRDPFNKPQFNQVLRLFAEGKAELLTDGTFHIDTYFLRYLKTPSKMDITVPTNCELSEHTHQEIVDMAIEMALENIESQRYQSQLNEITKQE
jgi:hypothetical protein